MAAPAARRRSRSQRPERADRAPDAAPPARPATPQEQAAHTGQAASQREARGRRGGASGGDKSKHAILVPLLDSDSQYKDGRRVLDAILLCHRIHRMVPHLSNADAMRVPSATEVFYVKTLEDLCTSLRHAGRDPIQGHPLLPLWDAETWDPVLLDYMEQLVDRGLPRDAISKVPFALLWANPALGPSVRQSLPLCHALLDGLRRPMPLCSRPPLPKRVAFAIAADLVQDELELGKKGHALMGLAVITMFIAYLRPADCLALQYRQLVRKDQPPQSRSFFTFVPEPKEAGRTSSASPPDVDVPIDLPEHMWIAKIWDRLAERGAQRPQEHVF